LGLISGFGQKRRGKNRRGKTSFELAKLKNQL